MAARTLATAAVWVFVASLSSTTATRAAATGKPPAGSAAKVDFNQEIRPILSENCFKCHGPDGNERKARLRFDIRDEALKPAKSGEHAIVPGAPEKSQLVVRTGSKDADEVMPPPKSGKKLTPKQIELLRRWVEQGAPYATHWSYVKPVRPALPEVQPRKWPRNPIDRFILARLEREGLKPSPEADRQTLIRRVSLDLTGLPPTLDEVDQFVKERSAGAYEQLVDRLLQRKTFGGHWARMWLDLVRYADSAGYADDPPRSIWAFRDYVIKAFNSNKPFDRFTIEQIAGDLLDNPTEEELFATACHRNTMTNSEGGTNDEEFRNAAIVDRVNTTMSVWMGTSMACAQCHNHKYDPISQQEYFRFFALFNNTEDADRNDEAPVIKFYAEREKQQRTKWEAELSAIQQKLKTPTPELLVSEAKWAQNFPLDLPWLPLKPAVLKAKSRAAMSALEDGAVLLASAQKTDVYTLELAVTAKRLAALRVEALPNPSLPGGGPGFGTNGGFVVSRVTATILPPGTNQTVGRFVRVELPGKEKYLSLAEVQVFSGADNIAVGGEASQSSTAFEGAARLAIDGNTDGDYEKAKSTTHTESSENPWWEVDLKTAQPIDRIVVWNRTDNKLQARLSDFRVKVLNEKREPAWEKTVKKAPNPSVELGLDGSRSIAFAAAHADVAQTDFDLKSVFADKADKKKGWAVSATDGKPHSLMLLPEKAVDIPIGSTLRVTIEQISEKEQQTLGCFRLTVSEDERAAEYARTPAAIVEILTLRRTPQDRLLGEGNSLMEYYLGNIAPELKPDRDRLAELKKQLDGMKPSTVPVMHELAGDKRRKTRIQFRGNFMDLGDEVAEGVPAAFQPLAEGAPRSRLQLAKWIVDENNPLTARVIANRFWEQIFGIGIVRTSEEFGSQGDRPTHPELLDWLATELVAQKWDVKAFLKLLVTSAAYRQSSRVPPALQERDPDNLLLARGPRFRMPAEMVRDQALFVSGLLSAKMYGPSIRPPRPSLGLNAAFGGSLDWKTSEGEDQHRRGLYVEWRRTSPYPSMAAFDAPSREVCTLRRVRSNTPLQALVTLNDPVYVEAAQALARRIVQRGGSAAEKARFGFRLCVARAPKESELSSLLDLYAEAHKDYALEPAKAKKLATEPIGAAPAGADVVELAAWTTVGNVLLNLDEMLMRR